MLQIVTSFCFTSAALVNGTKTKTHQHFIYKILVSPGLSSLWVPCPPQIFADKLTLSRPGGADYAHYIYTGTPVFSDLPTAMYLDLVELETIFFQKRSYSFVLPKQLKPNYFKKQCSSSSLLLTSKLSWSTQQASSMHLIHGTRLLSTSLPL